MDASTRTHPAGQRRSLMARARRARRTRSRSVARGHRRRCSRRGPSSAWRSRAAWVSTHLVTYPLGIFQERADGWRGYRIEHLAPVQRGLLISNVEAAGTPILLVHGLIDNRSIFTLLRRGLTRRGFNSIYCDELLAVHGRRAHRGRPARRGDRGDRPRRPATRRSTSSATASAGSSRATTSPASAATRTSTPSSRSAPPTRAPTPRTPSRRGSSARCARAAGCIRELDEPAPGLHDPLHQLLVRHRPPHRPAGQRRPAPPRPLRAQHPPPRRRAHLAADRRRRRPRHLDGPGRARPATAAR